MESDTRFVCARDLFEGIEARPVAGARFRRVRCVAQASRGRVEVGFEGNRVPVFYERDDELEVVA